MNLRGPHGNTPLHVASELGLVNVCRVLLNNGADSSVMNHMRNKPVDVAMPTTMKVLHEEPIRGDGDVESQLLEASKNGDLALIKVRGALTRLTIHQD